MRPVFLFLALPLLLGGCAARPPLTPPAPRHSSLRVEASLVPPVPRALDTAVLLVAVTDARGDTIPGAQVVASPSMPGMDMGKHPVTLSPAAPGHYQGVVPFTMPGAWNIAISARWGDKEGVAVLPVTVR